MKLFGTSLIRRKYLLPLLLTVTVFFVSQGICVPNFATLQQAAVSKIRSAKPHAVVVVKDQLKSPHSRVLKTTSYVDLCSKVGLIERPTAARLAFGHEFNGVFSHAYSTVPARAPPA